MKTLIQGGGFKLILVVIIFSLILTPNALASEPPTINSFILPATSTTLITPITLSANDDIAVAGYILTETSATPALDDPDWQVTPPSEYIFAEFGSHTLYAWAKDGENNISTASSGSIEIIDTIPPTITSFTLPETSNSLFVQFNIQYTENDRIQSFYASLNNETPDLSDEAWTNFPFFEFPNFGEHTLYLWLKDYSDNISEVASTTISISDIAPVISAAYSYASGDSLVTIRVDVEDNHYLDSLYGSFVNETPALDNDSWQAINQEEVRIDFYKKATTIDYLSVLSEFGSNTIYIWAKDNNGNISEPFTLTYNAYDAEPPIITEFSLPAIYNNKTVPLIFNATDNFEIANYKLTAEGVYGLDDRPSSSDPLWQSTKPSSYTFSELGTHILYGWVNDLAGIPSYLASTSVTIIDDTAPIISNFSLPATSTNLIVPITLTATDDEGVASYLLTETSTTPALDNPDWQITPPTDYTFSEFGNHVLYAWAKDEANNISDYYEQLIFIGQLPQTIDIATSTEHIISSSTISLLTTINISNSNNTSTLNLASTISSSTDRSEASILNDLVINLSNQLRLEIPRSTASVENDSWNGLINLPQIQTTSTMSSSTMNVFSSVVIGSTNYDIIFDKAVRLAIFNQADNKVGVINSEGAFREITQECSADSQTIGDNLVVGGDCKINSGQDLIIWTKHFSEFVIYETVSAPASQPLENEIINTGLFVPTSCAEVEYDSWQETCFNGFRYRNIKKRSPYNCQLTPAQIFLTTRTCSEKVYIDEENIESTNNPKDILKEEQANFQKENSSLIRRLSGLFLLQVEKNGQAWYLEPLTLKRYFLPYNKQAFELIKKFALGISNKDLEKIKVAPESLTGESIINKDADQKLTEKLRGRILLQTEGRGELWYLNPINNQRYYLKDFNDLFKLITQHSLGITNDNLNQIISSHLN